MQTSILKPNPESTLKSHAKEYSEINVETNSEPTLESLLRVLAEKYLKSCSVPNHISFPESLVEEGLKSYSGINVKPSFDLQKLAGLEFDEKFLLEDYNENNSDYNRNQCSVDPELIECLFSYDDRHTAAQLSFSESNLMPDTKFHPSFSEPIVKFEYSYYPNDPNPTFSCNFVKPLRNVNLTLQSETNSEEVYPLLAYELEKPTGVKQETLKWLDHNERAGYWKCGEHTHKFLECKISNKDAGDFC